MHPLPFTSRAVRHSDWSRNDLHVFSTSSTVPECMHSISFSILDTASTARCFFSESVFNVVFSSALDMRFPVFLSCRLRKKKKKAPQKNDDDAFVSFRVSTQFFREVVERGFFVLWAKQQKKRLLLL